MEDNEHEELKDHIVHKEHKPVHHDNAVKAHKSHEIRHRITKRLRRAKNERIVFISLIVILVVLCVVAWASKANYSSIDSNINSLNKLYANTGSTEAKAAINQAIASLESAKVSLGEEITNTGTTTIIPTGGLQAIILNDVRCKQCDVTGVKASLQQVFPTITFTELDYADAGIKEMMQDTRVRVLPAILFTKDIKNETNYAQIANYITETGTYLELKIGSSFDPTAEICDNNIDDTGNDLTDCEDPTCAETLACRELKENRLAVFIMSDCPYGKEAIKALAPVVEAMPDLDYEVNYIVTDNGDGTFRSLHGDYEVEENIRQLCAKEQGDVEFLAYALCRSENGVRDVDWNACADEVGLDKDALEACTTGEKGIELLTANAKIANALGIGASPTWLTNNRYKFSGITAEVVQSNVCTYNPDLEGCENIVTSTASVPAGQC